MAGVTLKVERAFSKDFKWAEGRSPTIEVDRSQSPTKVVYWLLAGAGICITCKRRWAKEGRRMCAECTNSNRDYQRKRRGVG